MANDEGMIGTTEPEAAVGEARADTEALWRRIEAQLRDEILSGALAAGARLPSEGALSRRFSAHRHTVRRALAALAQQGIVRTEQGRGSFVHDAAIGYAIGRRTRVEENLVGQHRKFSGRLLSAKVLPADAAASDALGLRGRTPRVLVVETLNEANGVPVSLVRHVMAAIRFAAFPEAYRASSGSVTAALAACGVPDFVRSRTTVSTRLPTPDEAKALAQPPVLPVLVSETIDSEPDGAPVKYAIARFAGERIRLVLDTGT